MCPSSDEASTPLDAFRASFRRDIANRAVRPLADYLVRFPGDDKAIARDYAAAMDCLSASSSPAAGESSAERLGPYRICHQIGRGGQATVYLAEHIELHRQVALKVLDPGFASDRTVFERFRREAEITSKLDHPGICTVYETGADRGLLWIAMRYVDGDSLAKKISTAKDRLASGSTTTFVALEERGALDDTVGQPPSSDSRSRPETRGEIARVLALFEDAARALHVAHEAGVVHRDIKPGNMIVTKGGQPVILDFGLAQHIEGDHPTLTMTGDIMGTPAYMSPEQIAAQRIRLDRRTDVYSLGVSLYECLTLRRPFDAPTREGLYQAIMTKEPPDLRRLNPAIPTDLRVVVATAIEKDRDRRYQTALDFAEELRRVRMHEPIVAKPVGPLVRLQRWAQRNPGLAVAIGGLFVVLAVGLAVALFLLSQRDRALAEVTKERNEKQTALIQVTTERNEKTAALTDYDRLGDLSRLQSLVAEADTLWPCEPSRAEAMKTWVTAGAALEKRLSGHTEVRDRHRASPGLLPYTEVDRAVDLAAHASEQERLGKLRAQRIETAASLAADSRTASRSSESKTVAASSPAARATSAPSLVELHTALAKLDAEIQRLDAQIHERLTWKFESSGDQFKHDTTAKLVADLTAFVDTDPNKGLLADVRGRLAFAESVERETLGKFQTKWADAIRSIADKNECPKYAGLDIKPQLGLIPIGRDPASGLWEFSHLQTTAVGTNPIPERGADGRLVVTHLTGIVFILLPGGSFRMGAVKPDDDHALTAPNVDPEAEKAYSPVTEIALDSFFMSKYEMTQAQWKRLVRRNPSQYAPGIGFEGKVINPWHPVEYVSWDECHLWLERLGLSLPTEAQWEYAARAGTTTPRWTGIGTDGLSQAANVRDASLCRVERQSGCEAWDDGFVVHAPVGSYAPNPFGLHDVLGNVGEWCGDGFAHYDVAPRAGDGLRTPPVTEARVTRGGSFYEAATSARSANRSFYKPTALTPVLGVRPAMRLSKL